MNYVDVLVITASCLLSISMALRSYVATLCAAIVLASVACLCELDHALELDRFLALLGAGVVLGVLSVWQFVWKRHSML